MESDGANEVIAIIFVGLAEVTRFLVPSRCYSHVFRNALAMWGRAEGVRQEQGITVNPINSFIASARLTATISHEFKSEGILTAASSSPSRVNHVNTSHVSYETR